LNKYFQKFDFFQKKKIVFTIVSIFAIQLLVLIFIYGENWSIEVGLGLPLTYSYFLTDNYPYELIFKESDSHIQVFSKIPLIISFFFDDFNTKNLMLIGWGLFSASIYLLYLILKRTDEKLIWVLIPLSAFVFNPIQYYTVLWAFALFVYAIPFFTTILMAYFLNKKNLGKKSFFIILIMGIISSFSNLAGVIVLISGLLPLIYKKEINKLVYWILGIIFVCTSYILIWSEKISEKILFSPENQIEIFLKLIALPYGVKFDILYSIVGIGVIILVIFSFIYIKKYQKIEILMPWIQMAFVGFFVSGIVTLGRGNAAYYYSTLTDLFSLSLIGFIGLSLFYWKDSIQKNKNLIKIIFIMALIVLLALLVPSYYLGWKLADDFNVYETKRNSCFSLNPDKDICNSDIYDLSKPSNYERFQIMNQLLKEKKGMFTDDSLNRLFSDNQKIYEEKLIKINYTELGFGKIKVINGIMNSNTIIIDGPLIEISGWILDKNKNPVEYMYIFSNDKALTKISHFKEIQDDTNQIYSEWKTHFLVEYLEEECNDISIVGFVEDRKIIIDDKVILCKNIVLEN
jgi:hypothetical protein